MNHIVVERTSKYVAAVKHAMHQLGHASNNDLIQVLRSEFPELSATTVHRITARLLERGELRLAPSTLQNEMRYDITTTPHDHFMCNRCGHLRDAKLDPQVRPLIEASIGDGCSISGDLTVAGVCKKCQKEGI